MALNFWGFPSLKAQTAHKKTYKGQRKGQLFSGWRGLTRDWGASWRRDVADLGRLSRTGLERKGDDNDHTEFGGSQEHKLCCSPQMNLSSGSLSVALCSYTCSSWGGCGLAGAVR